MLPKPSDGSIVEPCVADGVVGVEAATDPVGCTVGSSLEQVAAVAANARASATTTNTPRDLIQPTVPGGYGDVQQGIPNAGTRSRRYDDPHAAPADRPNHRYDRHHRRPSPQQGVEPR